MCSTVHSNNELKVVVGWNKQTHLNSAIHSHISSFNMKCECDRATYGCILVLLLS